MSSWRHGKKKSRRRTRRRLEKNLIERERVEG